MARLRLPLAVAGLLAVLLGHDVGMAAQPVPGVGHRHEARAALPHHADPAAEETPGHPPGCASVRAATVQRDGGGIDAAPRVAMVAGQVWVAAVRGKPVDPAIRRAASRAVLQVWRI